MDKQVGFGIAIGVFGIAGGAVVSAIGILYPDAARWILWTGGVSSALSLFLAVVILAWPRRRTPLSPPPVERLPTAAFRMGDGSKARIGSNVVVMDFDQVADMGKGAEFHADDGAMFTGTGVDRRETWERELRASGVFKPLPQPEPQQPPQQSPWVRFRRWLRGLR